MTVTLTSSDATKVSVSPASVVIPAGSTQPATAPQVTGVNLGTASITASAPTYTSATQPVQVTATISFSPQTLNISGTQTQNLTLTLSGPAPAGGLTFTVTSSNTAAATVSAGAFTIPANATSVVVPVTGVAAGSSVIRATAPNVTDATANVTVTTSVDIILPAAFSIGPGGSIVFPVRLAQPAQSLVVIQLTSSDPTKGTLSQSSVAINAGQTEPQRQPDFTGIAVGTVTITATATGLSTATTQVTIGSSVSFSPATLTLPNPGSDGTLFLTLSSHPGTNVTFALSSSNPDVATVPPSAPMPVGTTSLGLKVTAIGPGTTVIKASAPGFADATATVTVEQPGTLTMTANATNVQLGQPATLTLTLSKPAPAQGTTITLTSSNPKIKVNPASAFIAAGGTTVTAQATGSNVGSGTISASAPGFTSPAPITINVGATIEWASPNTTIVGTGQQILLDLRLLHTVPGGPDFSPNDGIVINLTSSRPDMATVVPSVNFFWDGSSSPITRVQVNSVGAGTTTITASGINIAPVTLTVTVTGPIAITTPSLPNGTVGTPYSFTVAANGGVPPLHWTATGLPAGLSIDNASGHITGTPTAPSSGSVTITVADSSTPTALTATGTFTLLSQRLFLPQLPYRAAPTRARGSIRPLQAR